MEHRTEYNIVSVLIEIKEGEDENKDKENKGIRGRRKRGRDGEKEKEGKEEGERIKRKTTFIKTYSCIPDILSEFITCFFVQLIFTITQCGW